MTARILDGKAIAARVTDDVRAGVEARVARGLPPPGLAVVLVGENAASQVYVRNKRRTTEATGMRSYAHDFPATVPEAELLALIDRLNADPTVSGILVQLPLPAHIDPERVTERIDPAKDVDGFHPINIGRLVLKRPILRPCTPWGCMRLLAETGEDLVGKHAVVIGQSTIVGRPMALELLIARCTVTICHSATRDLPGLVGQADIVVAGVGKAGFVPGRVDQAGRDRDRRRHQPPAGRQAGRRRRLRVLRRARVVDHAGARRRRADDDRDAAREHAEGGGGDAAGQVRGQVRNLDSVPDPGRFRRSAGARPSAA